MDLMVKEINKTFINGGSPSTVLGGVSFRVRGGRFVSLLGPSGCGKTTLLTIMAGFQSADKGEILLNGRPMNGAGPERGFVFQDYALFPWMTVKENILFPMKQQKLPVMIQEKRLLKLLEMARLTGSGHLYPSQISGGMKQRTAVVRALASDPEVLLMDEPFGAVDYQMRHSLQEEFEAMWLKDPKPVVMVTHDVEEAVFLSDRILVMSARGGAIAHDLTLDLPRPRRRDHVDFRYNLNRLTGILKNLQAS